jgi:hypothetical protein
VVSVPLAAGLTPLFSNGIVTAHRVGEPRRSCARWPRRDPGLAHVAHPRLDRAIAGTAGTRPSRLNRRTLRDFALAWTATPVAAGAVAASVFLVVR